MRVLTLPFLALFAAHAHAGELSIPHERFQLPNGLDVVLAPDHSAPVVHVQVWYHVGSKDEVAGRTGFAHLFEHLMFQGSRSAPGEYFTPIQGVGGDLNGTTNSERTNYYETVPAQYLPLALFMEADRMGDLLSVLDQGKLDNQREVVRNERRQRYENPPYGEAWADLYRNLYPEGHPYHHPTIGSHTDLEAATLDDVSAFFKTWYVPNNATLVVAGDFEPKVARKLVKEQFGWIPRGPDPVYREVGPVTLAADTKVVQYDEVPHRKVWAGWQSPAIFQAGDAELDLLTSALCNGRDSRLYDRLVRRDQIARDVDCGQGSRRLGSAFVFTATATDGHTTGEILAAIQDELTKLTTTAPITADELSAAKVGYEVGFYQGIQTIGGKAGIMSQYLDLLDQPDALQRDLDRYLQATAEGIGATAAKVFAAPHVELHILPLADRPAQETP